jgi:hypothetical protein
MVAKTTHTTQEPWSLDGVTNLWPPTPRQSQLKQALPRNSGRAWRGLSWARDQLRALRPQRTAPGRIAEEKRLS